MGNLLRVRDSGQLLHLERAADPGRVLCGVRRISHWGIKADDIWREHPEQRCIICQQMDGTKMAEQVEALRVLLEGHG